jgi:pimeloyl-ACP methyl ester carboxylesterase
VDGGRIGRWQGAGRSLRYRSIQAPAPRIRLVYLHGIESHGAWFLPIAEHLRDAGCTIYMPDRRGSGLNRTVEPGDAAGGAAALVEDVHRFRLHIGAAPAHLAALSWGGKLAIAAALQWPDDWRSLTLITPGLSARVDLPLRDKWAVAAGLLLGGHRTVAVPICATSARTPGGSSA